MSAATLKGVGVGCLVLAAVLFFAAWERYESNAANVRAIQQSPLAEMLGGANLTPSTPAATKYCVLFGVIATVGGVVCLVRASTARSTPPSAGP